jgi:hypothetical protein
MAAAYPGASAVNAIEAPGGASIYEEEGRAAPAGRRDDIYVPP